MDYREKAWRTFVEVYPIEVPEESVQGELDYITLEMRHRMQYDRLTGGDAHLFPKQELEGQAVELRAAAVHEAKAPLVLKELIAEKDFSVSFEELEAAAQEMAKRQNTTVDTLKQFFGEDLAMIKRDVLEAKVIDWVCEQLSQGTQTSEPQQA